MAPLAEPNIIILEIVCGVPRAPQDPFTDEPELQTLNLLNITGFSLTYDGWTPQLPSMKNGGLWADSALAPGRQLIAGEFGNVTETMSLIATAATLQNRLFLKSRLLEFARRARTFHTDWSEQQPVYLKWHAPSAPCAQYAIIYDINVAVENDAFDVDPDDVVITLEREPAWRWYVPPGGNPIEWTYFSRNMQRGVDYQYDDMALDSANSLVTGTANNRHEWTYNGGNPVTTPSSKNYVEILADRVPGDAPALVCVGVHCPNGFTPTRRLLMWQSSKELSGVDQVLGTPMAGGYIMNACDMTLSSGAAVVTAGTAATGVNNTAAVPAKQYVAIGLAGVIGTNITLGSDNTAVNFWYRQFERGRFAVYVRARQATGTIGDTRLKVTAEEISGLSTINSAKFEGQFVNIPVSASTGQYSLIYAGQFTIPFEGKSHIGIDGRGIYLKKFVAGGVNPVDFRFTFRFENFVAAVRQVDMLDAILVPIDEAFAEFRYDTHTSSALEQIIVMDNTGYLSRGKPDDIVVRNENATYANTFPTNSMEQRGNMPMLLPRTTQRLYFLNAHGSTPFSQPNADMGIFVNIVPRSYGAAAL